MKTILVVLGILFASGAGAWMLYDGNDGANTPAMVTCIAARKGPFVVSVRAEGRLLSRKTETIRALHGGSIADAGITNGAVITKGARLAVIHPLEEVRAKKQIELELAELDLALVTEQRLQAEELLQAKAASAREVNELKIRQRRQEALAQSLREELSAKIVSAPFAGMLVEKRFQHGDRLAAGAELCTLVDVRALIIEAKLHQHDLPKVRIGQSAILRSEIFVQPHVGKVFEIANVAAQNGNDGFAGSFSLFFNVNLQIDDLAVEERKLGARVEVEIILAEKANTLTVPLECVYFEGANTDESAPAFAFNPFAPRRYSQPRHVAGNADREEQQTLRRYLCVNENGVARKRSIITGAANAHMVEVLSGLREGEFVITVAAIEIHEGMKLKSNGQR